MAASVDHATASVAAPSQPQPALRPTRVGRLMDSVALVGARALCIFGIAFVIAPVVAVVGASFNRIPRIVFPPSSWSLDAYRGIPEIWFDAFFMSLRLAATTSAVACLIAVPAAMGLVKGRLPGRRITEAVLRLPLQVPSIVLGVAVYQFYVLLNNELSLPLRGTFTGLLLAHVLLVLPFMLTALIGRVDALGPQLEEAAYGLGATPLRTFFRIVLPLLRPAIVAAMTLAFVISFDNVTLSLFLSARNVTTFPVVLFSASELTLSPIVYAGASLAVGFSLVLTFLVNKFVGLRTVLSG